MTSHGGQKFLEEGERREICPNCSPQDFQDPFLAPVDRRLWHEHEAKPYLYHMRPDGFFELNDSPKADLMAEWEKDPDEEKMQAAIAKKRATRRTRPLEAHEIEAADRAWRPLLKQQAESIRQQEEGDKLYTENLVENLLRKDHDAQTIQ